MLFGFCTTDQISNVDGWCYKTWGGIGAAGLFHSVISFSWIGNVREASAAMFKLETAAKEKQKRKDVSFPRFVMKPLQKEQLA